MKRVFRIILGLALIGYGVVSGNAWFFLGVIPLVFGLVNWCPMEKFFGAKCDGGSCGCSGGASKESVPQWSAQKPQSGCCGTSSASESSCCSGAEGKVQSESACCGESQSEPCCTNENCIKIEVLGTGCQKCKTLEAIVKEAILPYGDKYCVAKVEDAQKIISYGVMSTPALVIDGKVVISGRVPSTDEIAALLK